MESSDFAELIPGLPEELGLECLTRVPYRDHRVAAGVSHQWRVLFKSRELYALRRKNGLTRKLACLVQALPVADDTTLTPSPKRGEPAASFGIAVFDAVETSWFRVDAVPKYPDRLPLFCRVASCDGKLVVLGGLDPKSYKPVDDIFVYDFGRNQWREGRKMPTKRSFFAVGADSGRVYVAGGHDENKNALSSAWCYDLERDEWTELARMSQERDECEGFAVRGEFWVVSGYPTEGQGRFEGSAEVYEIDGGMWRRVEGAWEEGRCPLGSVVGAWREGESEVACWGRELYPAVVGEARVVGLGQAKALAALSGHQGGTREFYVAELKGGGQILMYRMSFQDLFNVLA